MEKLRNGSPILCEIRDDEEERRVDKPMKKIAILLMVITGITKASGFFRDIMLSYYYGASSLSDAYIISVTISNVLFSLIFTGLSTGYIALFSVIEMEFGKRSVARFTNNLVNIIIILSTVLIILGFIFAELLVKVFAFGFDEETMKTAILLTRIGLLGIYFSSISQLFISHLQLKEKFATPAISGLPYNILIIISIFISAQTNIITLAIGTVLATLAQLLFLLPSIYRTNYRYEPILNLKDENIKKMLFFVYPIAIGMSIDNVNLMIDKTLASKIVVGGISSMEYASRLNGFVNGVFVLSFVTVMFPFISKMAALKNTEEFKKTINDVLGSVMILVIPASIGIMVLAEPIIRLLYGRGNFDEHAVLLTSQALFFYSIGMVGYGARNVLLRVFYSLQDMKTPMYNVLISVFLNIVLNLVLSAFLGIKGLALATSISALFSAGLLLYSLRKKIGSLGMKDTVNSFLKVIIASSIMGLTIFMLNEYLLSNWNDLLKMGVVIIIGIVLYFILILMLKVSEAQKMIRFFQQKFQLGVIRK